MRKVKRDAEAIFNVISFRGLVSPVFLALNTEVLYVQSKAGPNALRVKHAYITHTYKITMNVFTMLTMFKKLSNMAPPSPTRGPCLDADFCLSQTRAGTQRPARKIPKASRVVCYSFISYLNS